MFQTLSRFFAGASRLIGEALPPKPRWSIDDIPDLTGKVVIVTGGNAGVGKETCRALLLKNARVYMAARSASKAQAAIDELRQLTGKTAIFLQLDLASLRSIKASVDEFTSKERELHILFNNGGVMMPDLDKLTEDGYDLQFGTNVLGHFYFTTLILPTMTSTARDAPPNTVRVITTSSSAHVMGDLDFDTLAESANEKNLKRRELGRQPLYGQSKFGNVLFARELARRYADQGIVSTSCNPGNLKTDLWNNVGWQNYIINLMLYPAPMGALTQLYAGTAPEAGDANGEYFIPWARRGRAIGRAEDPELARKMWDWCEAQVKNI